MELQILSAGAAQGLVKALQEPFLVATGSDVRGSFGAVGAMKEKLLAGEPCDLIILTAALIDELARAGHVRADSGTPLGRVRTGIAVRRDEAVPDIADRASFRASLLAANGIYLPDPQRATAGIHFVNILRELGVYGEIEPRLRPYPNGATAMRELAQSTAAKLIGCTQISEIKYTEGVQLVGPLPAEFELATVYSAAVCSKARQPDASRRFIELLAGPESEKLRIQAGFEF
jgi:molybdate transport system substrate-binding protein